MRDWNELMENRETRDSRPMKPQVAARALDRCLGDDTIIAADCGTVTTWAARHLRVRENTLFSASGSLATMANGLPYAIAAAVAFPGRQVVAAVGDGGLTMLMGELATVAKYRLPIKIVRLQEQRSRRDQMGAAGDGGQPLVRGRPTPHRFRRRGPRLRPTRLQRRRSGARSTPSCRKPSRSRTPRWSKRPSTRTSRRCRATSPRTQALHFAEALARGDENRFAIIKDVIGDKVREVI